MRNKNRTLRRNMLVVCEGSVTEPEYLALLRKMALEIGVWDEIDIRPKPRSEMEETTETPNSHKSPRPKRQLKTVPIPDEADTTESRYLWRQTPVNFVKEARSGLKEDTFQEAWAVFDRNGHPAHEHAFALSRETDLGNTVNIAFSSVAFEHWILLHFERNGTAFAKSECKDEKGRYLNCGTGEQDSDCWGGRCVAGYLRTNAHIEGSTKKRDNGFANLFQKLLEPETSERACENAAWLRHTIVHNPLQPYLTNPFTNVDALLKRFLGKDDNVIEWANRGERKSLQSLSIMVDTSQNGLNCTVSNHSATSRLFNGYDIAAFVHENGQKIPCSPHDSDMLIPAGASRLFILHRASDWQDLIFEITTMTHRLLVKLF